MYISLRFPCKLTLAKFFKDKLQILNVVLIFVYRQMMIHFQCCEYYHKFLGIIFFNDAGNFSNLLNDCLELTIVWFTVRK